MFVIVGVVRQGSVFLQQLKDFFHLRRTGRLDADISQFDSNLSAILSFDPFDKQFDDALTCPDRQDDSGF